MFAERNSSNVNGGCQYILRRQMKNPDEDSVVSHTFLIQWKGRVSISLHLPAYGTRKSEEKAKGFFIYYCWTSLVSQMKHLPLSNPQGTTLIIWDKKMPYYFTETDQTHKIATMYNLYFWRCMFPPFCDSVVLSQARNKPISWDKPYAARENIMW